LNSFIKFTKKGIYCDPGGFYLDPWGKVDYAIISHGHSDHARWGMKHYLCHDYTKPIIQHRLGQNISVESLAYFESKTINGVKVSFYPAGHLIGSAQIRLEYKGEVIVFSGDYKVDYDGISTPFEPVKCHTFITESTFGLPIYNWQSNDNLKSQLLNWIERNQQKERTSIKMISKLPNTHTAVCSGWMQIRGNRRWQSVDAGFAISDHADWTGLLTAVKATGAQKVYVTHGSQAIFSKYLNEIGIEAHELKTDYGDQIEEKEVTSVNSTTK